ncbi:MAG TPA: tetratricopeptide repeat protein, partial [Chitinophagaceae bacterium]|nr:tetratricopeptide repeat protein [Chitinophagaceae bacterium]
MHPDTLRRYVTIANQIAAASANKLNMANAAYYEAVLLNRLGKIDSAFIVIEKNLQLPDEKTYQEIKNNFALLKGNLLIRNNRQKEAIETCLALLHIADANKDAALAVKAKTVLGWANMELGQNRESLKWSLDAIDEWQRTDTSVQIAVTFNNTAAVYNELQKNDSAEIYVRRAIQIAQREQNLTSLTNGYYIYSDICVALGDSNKAEALLKEGLKIRRQIGDVFYIVSDIAQLGVFYANNNEPAKGIEAVKEGIDIAEQNNLYAKLPFLYSALAKNYKAAGDMVNYTNALNKIIVLKDSLYAKNSAEALAEMQTRYEV